MLISLKNKTSYFTLFIIFLLFLFLISFLSTLYGDVSIPINDVFTHFKQNYFNNTIIHNYRLPRVLTGMCLGANFALSGCLLQAATKNPLASPNIIGINSGASFFAVIGLMIFSSTYFYFVPLLAFVGAIFAVAVVYVCAWKQGITQNRFILAGIAIDALFQASCIAVLILRANQIGNTLIWLSGSLWGKDWNDFYFILPCTLFAIIVTFIYSYRIQISTLEDDLIKNLGISPTKNRMILILISTLLSAVCVSIAGPIGSVSLIIPHFSRLLFGLNYKLIIPFSAVFGGILIVFSDFLGRVIISPNEIPVGVIATLLGSPYFIYLILKIKL